MDDGDAADADAPSFRHIVLQIGHSLRLRE